MKLLNFFQFNESTSDFYYGAITYGQYQSLFSDLVKFYKSDYDFLSNLISDKFKIEYKVNQIQVFKTEFGYSNQAPQVTIAGNNFWGESKAFIISKKKDEYFIVQVCDADQLRYANRKENYYYCDQLDGLVKFLSSFGVTKQPINENKRQDDIIYIFDLDDTLVLNPKFEELAIKYLKEDVSIKSLLNYSVKKIGVGLSDLNWENKKIYVNDPDLKIEINGNWVRKGKRVYLIQPDKFYYTDMSLPIGVTNLYEFYNSVKNKAIVTARPNDIKEKIIESLKKFKLDIPNYGLYCYPATKQTDDKVSTWKSKVIVKIIKESGFKNAEFYDDNSRWVNKITAYVKKELPNINWKGIKYKHKNG